MGAYNLAPIKFDEEYLFNPLLNMNNASVAIKTVNSKTMIRFFKLKFIIISTGI